ncbi:MAG TPA: hypothetical protein VEO01_32905 [Pseudonocardiaceae bacterium]|nr:hypothetical protein [Pseudonocardiaceae bacterium]
MPLDDYQGPKISRRNALRAGFGVAVAAQLAMIEQAAFTPARAAAATPLHPTSTAAVSPRATTSSSSLPAIQFDIGNFIAPPVTLNDGAGNVTAQFGPVFQYFVPATFRRIPTVNDISSLDYALNTIEDFYAFSPSGIFVFVSYGVPYFNLFNGGINGGVVRSFMPQLLSGRNPDGTTNALAEAVPGPTDVVGGLVGGAGAPVPGVTKDRFNVNVQIEKNHMLFQMRSDSMSNLNDVLAWLKGSNRLAGQAVASPPIGNLISFGTTRVQFVQRGLPRTTANNNSFEFAPRVNPDSPMWMGFTDQQTDSSAPAAVTTLGGTNTIFFTTAFPNDYLGQGSIVHFSHVIEDLFQFYSLPNQDSRHPDGEDAPERLMYMFRANQESTTNGLPSPFNATDPFANGGCPAFVNNRFQGRNDASLGAQDAGGLFNPNSPPGTQQTQSFTGLPRIGHEQALQRSSRASNGTPLHIRMDGPGLSGLDVPAFQTFPGGPTVAAGSVQPTLEFAMFFPTSEFFRQLRINVGAQDLQVKFKVDPDDNGLERFITTTRRQNFLTPPRNVRSLPGIEFN